MNLVVLEGTVNETPSRFQAANGQEWESFDLITVDDEGKRETIRVSRQVSSRGVVLVGEESVTVVGQVRRRFFRAGGAVRSSTDVRAESLVLSRRKKSAERLRSFAAALVAGEDIEHWGD